MIVYIWPIRSWIPAQGQKHSPTLPTKPAASRSARSPKLLGVLV